jgi:cobalt/nickel transport system permease protein
MLYSPEPMHIPDGFLSVTVSVILWLLSILAIAYSLRRVGRDMDERQVPLMGVLAAAIFAAQMLNFAVAGGTSGHLVGAAIATILLGPWAAVLVLATVVGVQALIFQDGGLLALGANIFNMGVIGVTVAYFAYRTIQKLAGDGTNHRGKKWGVFVGGFVSAWLSIEISALAVALQLALSGTSPANIAIPAMAGIHALIGIGEGLITLGTLGFIYATRRDLVQAGEAKQKAGALVWIVGLAIAAALAILSPLASKHPDGLMWVARQKGFLDTAQGPLYEIIPSYLFPGVSNQAAATIISAILGAVIVFGVALAVAYSRRKKQTKE